MQSSRQSPLSFHGVQGCSCPRGMDEKVKEKVAEEVQGVGRGCNGCITAGSWRTGFSAPTPQTLHDNVIPFNPSEPRKPWDVSGAAPRRCSLNPRSAQPVHLLSLSLSFCFSPFLSPLRLIIVLLLTLFFTSSRTFAPLLCVQLTPGFFQSKPNACVRACMYVYRLESDQSIPLVPAVKQIPR